MRTLTRIVGGPGTAIFRAAIGAIAVVAVSLTFTESSGTAAAPSSEGLIAYVHGEYDVRPDEGVAHVRWNATLSNTGPSPFLEGNDPLNNPSEIEIFVPAGFSDFRATSAGGAPLQVAYEDLGYGSIAAVQLGYNMPYGDVFGFDYSYTLASSSESGTIIRPTYTYVDAYHGLNRPDAFDSSSLRLIVPNAYAQNVAFEYAECAPEAGAENTVFNCVGNPIFGVYADLEVIDEEARMVVPEDIEIDGQRVELILRYWEGDEAWAEGARKMLDESLPIYAEIFGAAYAGPSTIRISEKGGSELYGAAGLAACQNTICALAVSPAWDDQTLLHEISHMWSTPFDNRWLTEGIAEYVSLKAASALGIPGYEDFGDPAKAPQATSRQWHRPEEEVVATEPNFDLDPWGGRFGFSVEDLFIDPRSAYAWSARFWQEIEIRHGLEPFQKVMADIQWKVAEGSIDSEAIMDQLEDVAGITADDLFKSYIFPEEYHAVLDERRAVRDRLTALETRRADEAPELDAAALAPVKDAIRDWNFEAARASLGELEPALESYLTIRDDLEGLRSKASEAGLSFPFPWEEGNRTWAVDTEIVGQLDPAYEAIEAYLAAKADVEAPRGIFQRIGLLGKNDHAELDDAAGHFSWARFDESIESSRAAQAMIEGSHGDGVTYATVTGVIVIAMLIFIGTVYVVSRRQEAASQSGTEVSG